MAEAFILKNRKRLSKNIEPDHSHLYDPILQLWINTSTGEPVVTELTNRLKASQFGETTMTKTSGEGVDHTGEALQLMSQFGETSITETREGVDSSESVAEAAYVINSLI